MLTRIAGQEGQGVVEYGLILFAISLTVVSILALLGTPIQQIYQNIVGLLPSQ